MTKSALLPVILALFLPLCGCGNSDKQQGSASVKPGTASDMPDLCSPILRTGLAKQCIVNSRDSTIDITIDSFDDEAARNTCADIANKTVQLAAHLSVQWKLQVYSPYRSDKPLASCFLR